MSQTRTFPFAIDPYTMISEYKGTIAWLNGNQTNGESLLALGVSEELILDETKNAFERLKNFYNVHPGWLFGYLSYDLKNDIENLTSKNPDLQDFPTLHFFRPKGVIELSRKQTILHIINSKQDENWEGLIKKAQKKWIQKPIKKTKKPTLQWIGKESYIKNFNKIANHIQQGDIYEVNYCMEFKATDIEIDPLDLYKNLNENTKAPFSVFYRSHNRFLLSGSLERYLKKEGDKLISQPIKGTIKRGQTEEEDQELKIKLFNDPKERAENVMIVDVVRNDLSRVARRASVKVDELYGVYTFKTVHHLVSTVSARLKKEVHPVDAIKASFPMASMTGAPKIRAMKIIEESEDFKRGLYSGAFGCFMPNGDFDFNVIIRSILYNEKNKMLSFPVGGAITAKSNVESEYLECILKAEGMAMAIQKS